MTAVPSKGIPQPHSGDTCLAPAGWRVLVPGLPHWFWGQRDQACVFFGFHAGSMAIGLFAWGTWLSLLMITFAYAAHAVSASDAIKRAAFPKFGPWVPFLAASLGLGAICYAPMMLVGSTFAWPVVIDQRSREAYWVNRWAYLGDWSPRHGETIWIRAGEGARHRLARVLAGEGQKVCWSNDRLEVDDQPVRSIARPWQLSHDLELTVPDRHVLVSFRDDHAGPFGDPTGWEIVAQEEIHGRAWAQSYPVWNRRLLR